jgi:hypothetical protein
MTGRIFLINDETSGLVSMQEIAAINIPFIEKWFASTWGVGRQGNLWRGRRRTFNLPGA